MKVVGVVFFTIMTVGFGIVAILSLYHISDDWRYGFAAGVSLGGGVLCAALINVFPDLIKDIK